MTFKYYPLAICILGVLVGFYVYNLTDSSFSVAVPFSDLVFTMPVALWVVMIIYAFFLISIVFIFSERLQHFLDRNALNHDKKKFVSQIKNKIIQKEEKNLVFKTKMFKELSSIIDCLNLAPKEHVTNCENNELKKLFAMHENLLNGEEIDVHKFNIPQTSSLFTLNVKNSIAKNYRNGLPIIKNKNYIYELKKFAFIALLNNANSDEIEKYKDQIGYDRDIAMAMMECVIAQKVNLSAQEINTMCKNAKFSKDDYMHLARLSKGKLEPHEWIRMFENLADSDENAENAYFYVLLELEMIEVAKSRLRAHPTQDFLNVRAYLDLKSSGKSYTTELFF